MKEQFVYMFSAGNKDMKNILGGKGANLAEMIKLGINVPNGFTITTSACNDYYQNNHEIKSTITEEIMANLHKLEDETNKKFGDPLNPLLLSIRSGSPISMPGMMDTILNLGLNDQVVEGLANLSHNRRFAYDSYRRFITMYADVVKKIDKSNFDNILNEIKKQNKITFDYELSEDELFKIINKYKEIYKIKTTEDFPQNPQEQLLSAIKAVFESWNNERAVYYRKLNNIKDTLGTAVNVQEMVYGNMSNNSATGVAFTRNPATGEHELYGEFLINAQGEDIVAGIRTPKPINELKKIMPDIYEEFINIANKLEQHYKDMQDMEFTIENNRLYILQTRNGKRTSEAAVKIAVDLVNEKLITKEEAILKIDANSLEQLLHKTFKQEELAKSKPIAKGIAASPGSASGQICFSVAKVNELANKKEPSILVTLETSPEDIEGMNSASGVLTIHGGMTSHAAVVARGMGKCCITGCSDLTFNKLKKQLITNQGKVLKEGDYISIDGSTGLVYEGKIETENASLSNPFKTIMSWAEEIKKLSVRANADNPRDALQALEFNAEGIGLCRTEHMFFEPERIFNFRKMILSNTKEEREKALADIMPYQKEDFKSLFRIMNNKEVVIRYLDPPLHEFLPKTSKEIKQLAKSLKITPLKLEERIASLKEFNPMMGHRGCRLGITYPEIIVMQTTAVIEAAIDIINEGLKVYPEIMIPLICDEKELAYLKQIITKTADDIISKNNVQVNYKIGTMIELPRAALTANKIAKHAEFFSFGTNDLTQMTYGFSRDDAGKFLKDYYQKNIFKLDPFASLDQEGVGELIKIAVNKARSTNPNITLGICGEHAGDVTSIIFCHNNNLDYVSCSPYRIPVAKIAAAQAQILAKMKELR